MRSRSVWACSSTKTIVTPACCERDDRRPVVLNVFVRHVALDQSGSASASRATAGKRRGLRTVYRPGISILPFDAGRAGATQSGVSLSWSLHHAELAASVVYGRVDG